MAYREDFRAKRQFDYGLENALAKHVRRRWPDKAIAYVAHEWGLTDSEAAKVVYAGASKAVLNKILHHKRGGFSLFLELLCDATNTRLEDYIREQAREAANERAKWEARERSLEVLQSRLAEPHRLDRQADQPSRAGRPGHTGVGASEESPPVESRSFNPPPKRGGGR